LIALKNKAIKGDIKAAEWLLERAYSKAKQSVQQEVDVSLNDTREQLYRNLIRGKSRDITKNE